MVKTTVAWRRCPTLRRASRNRPPSPLSEQGGDYDYSRLITGSSKASDEDAMKNAVSMVATQFEIVWFQVIV